jgi:hypothetical protein
VEGVEDPSEEAASEEAASEEDAFEDEVSEDPVLAELLELFEELLSEDPLAALEASWLALLAATCALVPDADRAGS